MAQEKPMTEINSNQEYGKHVKRKVTENDINNLINTLEEQWGKSEMKSHPWI